MVGVWGVCTEVWGWSGFGVYVLRCGGGRGLGCMY